MFRKKEERQEKNEAPISAAVMKFAGYIADGMDKISKSIDGIENDTQTLQKLMKENDYLKNNMNDLLNNIVRVFSHIRNVSYDPSDGEYLIVYKTSISDYNKKQTDFLNILQKNVGKEAPLELLIGLINIIEENK